MPDHSALQALLQDRKTSTKGRASKWMNICLDAKLSLDLALAEQELDAVDDAIAEAEKNGEKRAGGKVAIDPELAKRKKEAEKVVADAEVAVDAASVTVTFTALKAKDYDELQKKHPPRDGNQMDLAAEHNRDTFPDALMFASATKVEDVDGNLIEMDLTELLETLSDGERVVACQVSNDVNGRNLSVPFSDASLPSRRRSGSSSKRR
jgi:hypothetical protein